MLQEKTIIHRSNKAAAFVHTFKGAVPFSPSEDLERQKEELMRRPKGKDDSSKEGNDKERTQ